MPEYAVAQQMAAEGRAIKVRADVVRSYVDSVHLGVPAFVNEGTVLHDPRAGKVEGKDAFREFVESSAKWLDEAQARTEWVASTATPRRAVGELVVRLVVDGKEIGLPIAVVAEQKADHSEFRVDYSQWPLLGRHSLRAPILKDTGVEPEGWPAKYHAALTAGDADAIAAAFEPEGYFREPSGAEFIHGGEDLHPFFKMFFSVGGGFTIAPTR